MRRVRLATNAPAPINSIWHATQRLALPIVLVDSIDVVAMTKSVFLGSGSVTAKRIVAMVAMNRPAVRCAIVVRVHSNVRIIIAHRPLRFVMASTTAVMVAMNKIANYRVRSQISSATRRVDVYWPAGAVMASPIVRTDPMKTRIYAVSRETFYITNWRQPAFKHLTDNLFVCVFLINQTRKHATLRPNSPAATAGVSPSCGCATLTTIAVMILTSRPTCVASAIAQLDGNDARANRITGMPSVNNHPNKEHFK